MNFKETATALGFEEDEFHEMLGLFVATTHEDIKKLKAAIDEGVPVSAAEAAHSIKGAARGFGFDELSRAAEAIEKQMRSRNLDRNSDILAGLEAHLAEIVSALREHGRVR